MVQWQQQVEIHQQPGRRERQCVAIHGTAPPFPSSAPPPKGCTTFPKQHHQLRDKHCTLKMQSFFTTLWGALFNFLFVWEFLGLFFFSSLEFVGLESSQVN